MFLKNLSNEQKRLKALNPVDKIWRTTLKGKTKGTCKSYQDIAQPLQQVKKI